MDTSDSKLWKSVAQALEDRDVNRLLKATEDFQLSVPPEGLGLDDVDDGRWQLIRDLRVAVSPSEQKRPWSPIRARPMPNVVNLDDPVVLFTEGLHANEIIIEVDNRVSFRLLQQQLQRAWPTMLERGWIRRTRPLGDRALALLRFVCLQSPLESTWRRRRDAWNEQYSDWAYGSSQAFHAAFRRAEEQLTGVRYGLEWFYDPLAHIDLFELKERARAGDRGARERLGRLQAEREETYPIILAGMDASIARHRGLFQQLIGQLKQRIVDLDAPGADPSS